MNSNDRHQARYKRRKRCREKAKARRNKDHSFEAVSSFGALRRSFYQSRKGVNWKASVQRYGANVLRNAYNYSQRVRAGEDISRGFVEFTVRERGKIRNIKSVHISERVVQKADCDYGICPVMEKSLINENSASQKGKGTDFTANGLVKDLHEFYRSNGFSNEGWILVGDAHNFFGSLQHDVIRDNLNRCITDERLIEHTMRFINAFQKGLGLGSQVCQISAVAYQSSIDHYIKEVLRRQWYRRYMDDWYVIGDDKKELEKCRQIITDKYAEIGIQMNEKKTQIIKLGHGFEWLKDKYYLTNTGKVIRKPNHGNITRDRRKLKKMISMYHAGNIEKSSVESFYASFCGYIKHKNGHRAKRNMDNLYKTL